MEALVNTQPRVLAVVVTYNAMRWADRCLGSLLRSSLKPAVLVVDNGSSDGTREHVRSAFPEVRLECRPENPGFGAANNIGLRMALEEGFDFVYLMNQDAWVEEDTLELLAAAHRPEFGVLSPVQNTAEGAPDANFQRWCGSSLRLGGFSPAFRQYGEDDNYIHRLHWHGFSCGVVPAASAVHDRSGRSLPKEGRMRLKCVAPVVKLSNPGGCLPLRLLAGPLELAAMSVKNLSAYPLRQIPALLRRYPELIRLRAASKAEGAFL